jgi:predicted nucleotidyltransferase
MPVTQEHLRQAVEIARGYGATRVVLFGSAAEDPERARDLDLAVAGVGGWAFFGLAARLERALGIAVDLVPLDPPSPLSRQAERWGRALYDQRQTA